MDKPKKLGAGTAVAGVGVALGAGAVAKASGGFKALSLLFASVFSHGAAADVALLAPAATHAATELTAAAPALRSTPSLAPVVTRAAVQTLVRVPGQEKQQLESLAGEQRDRFLVTVAQGDVKLAGLKAYLSGTFASWVPETARAFDRLGMPKGGAILAEARALPADSPRWSVLDQQFRALPKLP